MINGRLRKEVSGDDRRSFELNIFVSWAESVAGILNSKVNGSALFHRFMPTCAPPANPIPRTISIDLLRLDLSLTLADGRQCTLKSSSSDITESAGDNRDIYTCSFELEGDGIDGVSVSLRVEYQPAKRRFWFKKENGASVRVNVEGDDESSSKSLADFLNQKQDIVLIGLDGGEIVYQGRNFYKVDYSYAEQVLLDLIKRPANAPYCRTEKGSSEEIAAIKSSRAKKFPDGSLFRAVADRRIEIPFVEQLLICDDLGTECADFVAANFKNHQMALVHAKAGDGTKISASAFHDVVAQAMKNLVYLTRNGEVPEGVGSWRANAKWNKTNIPRLYRTSDGLPSGERLWKKLKSDIIADSDPELYVVLVTTGCCDSLELKQAASDRSKRSPEIAQLLHLLDGLNGYARQLGVRLIIYDLPYKSPGVGVADLPNSTNSPSDPLIKSQFRRRPERNITPKKNNSNGQLQGVRQWDMFVPLWFWHRTGTANRALPCRQPLLTIISRKAVPYITVRRPLNENAVTRCSNDISSGSHCAHRHWRSCSHALGTSHRRQKRARYAL